MQDSEARFRQSSITHHLLAKQSLMTFPLNPVRPRLKDVSPDTYADEEMLFLAPRSATRGPHRYMNSQRESPIDLKARKS